MITIKRVSMNSVKDDWIMLNKRNRAVSPFQEWGLAKTIQSHYLFFTVARREFPVFYEFFKDEKPIMIAPLAKRVSKDGTQYVSFASAATIAFQDFIYADDLSDDDMTECLQILSKLCGRIRLDNLSPESKIYQNIDHSRPVKEHVNVALALNNGYQSYYDSLSKHARQNVRTAYNRMNTDGKTYSVQKIIGGGIEPALLDELMDVYIGRRKAKYGNVSPLHEWFLRHYHFNSIALSKQKNSMYIVLKIDGAVAAFLAGYISKNREYALIPRLAINEAFQRYSPGVVLINESMKIIEETGIKYLDLSKGDEPYKLTMGGEIYYTYDFMLGG